MGCGSSNLKGDSFDGVNSPASQEVRGGKAEEPKIFTNSNIGQASPSKQTLSPIVPHTDQTNLEEVASSVIATNSHPPLAPTAPSYSSATSTSLVEALRTSSHKLSTLRQQWKERKGVYEPRDGVTGRGLHTGLTPGELKGLVEGTRAAGAFGFATRGLAGSTMGSRYIANEPAREGQVRPEELKALKMWQRQSQAGHQSSPIVVSA